MCDIDSASPCFISSLPCERNVKERMHDKMSIRPFSGCRLRQGRRLQGSDDG